MIGGSGLRKPQGGLKLKPGVIAWFGASSSPDMIIVTGVTDDRVSFRKYPYDREFSEQRWIFEDLVVSGTSRILKTDYPWLGKYKRNLEALLAGEDVESVNVSAWLKGKEKVFVYVVPKEGATGFMRGDAWYEVEQYGSTGELTSEQYDRLFEVNTDRDRLAEIRKNKKLVVVGVESSRSYEKYI